MKMNKRRFLRLSSIAAASALTSAVSIKPLSSKLWARDGHAELISYAIARTSQGEISVAVSRFNGEYIASFFDGRQISRYAVQLRGSRDAQQAILGGSAEVRVDDSFSKITSVRQGDQIVTTVDNDQGSGEVTTFILGVDDAAAATIAVIIVIGAVSIAAVAGAAYVAGKIIDAGAQQGNCTVSVSNEESQGFIADPHCDAQQPPLQC